MSSLSYLNYGIADVECRNVSAQAAVGRYRLLFCLKFDLKKWEDGQLRGYVPYVSGLRITAKVNGTVLGTVQPTEEDFLPPIDPAPPGTVMATRTFALDMDRQTVEAIEQMTEGRDVAFELEVTGTASILTLGEVDVRETPFGARRKLEPLLVEPRLTTALVYHRVPRSDWIELLNATGYGRTLLFEIPWPQSKEDGLSEAVSRFEAARALFLSGAYTESVGKLRDSLNLAAATATVGKLDWSKVAGGKSRAVLELQERFLLAWNAARHLTHSAHHDENFSREEARYVLGMCALALSLAAKAPGVLRGTENRAEEP